MVSYSKKDARDWARKALVGVANVTIPTMKANCEDLNEKAIRHDIEKTIEHGFVGTLAVSEVAITTDEYRRMCEIMVDQAKGRCIVFHHAIFNTLEDNIRNARLAQEAGAEIVLLGYPPFFHPKSLEDIYNYTKAFCDATDLAVMVFPIPTWGFSRLHPTDLPVPLLRRLVDECPNIVAIKAEGGAPQIMGAIEVYREFHKEVVISLPLEHEFVPLAQVMPIPFCGTNFSAYYGPVLPSVFQLLQDGKFDEATQAFYKMMPARNALFAAMQSGGGGGGLANRTMWKYQSWLQGYNGGPLRHPTGRIYSREMTLLRRGQQESGMNPTSDPDETFFVGRNPE